MKIDTSAMFKLKEKHKFSRNRGIAHKYQFIGILKLEGIGSHVPSEIYGVFRPLFPQGGMANPKPSSISAPTLIKKNANKVKKKKVFFPFTTFDDANNAWLQAKLEWVVSKNCNSLPGCANSWILFKYFKGFRSPFQAKCQSVQIETNAKQDSPISPKWNKINSKTALFLVFWRKKFPKGR